VEAVRQKWNNRYDSVHVPNQISEVLERNQHLLNGQGRALDLACGLGGNALRLSELGYESHAWDISDAAIAKVQEFARERQLNLQTRQCDVSQVRLEKESFDVIIVSRFLIREMAANIVAALKPDGLLFYQTFIQERTQVDEGPNNTQFRLEKNELLTMFSGLLIRFYREEGLIGDVSRGFRNEAMLVAQKLHRT
jgi:2-polyprenyl-3-methyl-5-hydroxy-6-metoxy-1,4-benzoquinol methylase